MNYYNEFDPHAAAWLRQLIADKLIPNGEVDERSITEVQPADLTGFTQCHFFAGIGGWSYALDLARYPRGRSVWTGSAPCQPFSSAGKQKAQADERHLWPAFFRLIRECRPDVVFGEQVSSAIRHGWLDGISADLEGEGYAVGAVVLGAHSVGSPHIRQRLFWVADADGRLAGNGRLQRGGKQRFQSQDAADVGVGDPYIAGSQGRSQRGERAGELPSGAASPSAGCGMAHAGHGTRCTEQGNELQERDRWPRQPSPWDDYVLIPCRDGKARRIKPGLAALAHGVPARVVRLRGYGNAIVPQTAAAFIEAFLETQNS